MANHIVVHRGRAKTITFETNEDLTDYTVTSHIRSGPSSAWGIIGTWTVEKDSDGSDGLLILSMTSEQTQVITQGHGYMDLKKELDGQSFSVITYPLEVKFVDIITE